MIVRLQDIHPVRGHVIDETLTVEAADELVEGFGGHAANGPFQVHVSMQKLGERVLVDGAIRGPVVAVCKRCLEPVEYAIEASTKSTFTPRGRWEHMEEEEVELESEELDLLSYEEDVINVTPWLRETLLLELEPAVLCNASCLGLCPHCGGNRNLQACSCADEVIDPRWEGLLALKEKKKSTS